MNQQYDLEAARRFLDEVNYSGSLEPTQAVEKIFSNPFLDERDKRVLVLRRGLLDGERKSLEKTAKEFDLTREWISKIEASAVMKIINPDLFRKKIRGGKEIVGIKSGFEDRFLLLIPTLGYDILYEREKIAEGLGDVSESCLTQIMRNLSKKLDLASITLMQRNHGGRFFMRIGEQEQDLEIKEVPDDSTFERESSHYCKSTIKRNYFNKRKVLHNLWKDLAKTVRERGWACYHDCENFSGRARYSREEPIKRRVFKAFAAESGLPVAYHQDCGINPYWSKPLIVYHPKILRQVQHKNSPQ